MQIIPAIDLIDGKCVRLTEGDYTAKTEYKASPLEMAKLYEAHGIQRLHLVDLDGAKKGEIVNWNVAEELATKTSLIIDFGGGIKEKSAVEKLISLGISYITIGSLAAKNPIVFSEWIEEFGPDTFLLGADSRNEKLAVAGWQEATSIDLIPYIKSYATKGVHNVFCTDIAKDGRLEGPSLDLYKQIIQDCPDINLIASGGVSCMEDILQLEDVGCSGVIIGKAIYENRISLKELEQYTLNTQ
jgi:phosphoribosylformimino-5-aminoimidazole carboxamide ribotide isomerase